MGPLAGVKVIELKGIGPGPYAGMLLADMGAEVICVERSSKATGIGVPASQDIHCRGKRSIALNLKDPKGVEILKKLVSKSDMLIEGFRPGVMEKLGLGPQDCLSDNPGLIYGRITGWGQTGPLSKTAGHDINYISLTGGLAAIGTQEKPVPPLNLLGDYAGGSLFLVMGMLAALQARHRTGKGDVIDAAITDGTASLMTIAQGMHSLGLWSVQRESNMLDGAAHFYRCYKTKDNKYISIGSIEPQFYQLLIQAAGLNEQEFKDQLNPTAWKDKQEKMEEVFLRKTQEQWCEIMEGTDICFAPVLDFTEAPSHPHNRARETYIEVDGKQQAAPAPRFAVHKNDTPTPPVDAGSDTHEILTELGFVEEDIMSLRDSGAIPV